MALVLVVDDTPETLALLHRNLEESGFDVLVATNGEAALKICSEIKPDIVLLDAIMPNMDGFEVCKRLKQTLETRHIPVIFMTGLTESEHVVAGFAAGAIDYVTKPLNPSEVIARLTSHLGTARQMTRTQGALDFFGQAAMALLPMTDSIIWQTPLSKKLLDRYFSKKEFSSEYDLSPIMEWVNNLSDEKRRIPFKLSTQKGKLTFTPADINNDEQWLILLKEESEQLQIKALQQSFKLTKRQAEVLHWITLGKTDKSIGEILGTSPRTVSKHTEHIFIKLGVETRTAAAAVAASKLNSGQQHLD
jgi:DNA-binding response OmpR family regulator/DNA-binding CsgD family transcriptional regulator